MKHLLSLVLAVLPVAVPAADSEVKIPLCEGLLIVTAIQQPQGDYESIKRIETIRDDTVRLKYSSERMVQDWLSNDPPTLGRTTVYREVDRDSLEHAKLYLQQFSDLIPEHIPDTTAIGVSRRVLESLERTGQAELGIFIAFSGAATIDREQHPNVYDNQMLSTVEKTGELNFEVLVDDAVVELPVLRAAGEFFGDKAEFLILRDPLNPLVLQYRIGIGANLETTPEMAKLFNTEPGPASDRDVLRVVKMSTRCSGEPPNGGGAGSGGASPGAGAGTGADAGSLGAGSGSGTGTGTGAGEGEGEGRAAGAGEMSDHGKHLEQSLAEDGQFDVYSIFFTFDSDSIREESEPTLREIAAVLERRSEWKLRIAGHTDSVASDGYNLDLSKRRAAAVKRVLVERHGVDPARLETTGFGEAQPRDTNETLAGRAKNRRVELLRR